MDSIENLLKPRYKVIAGYPGSKYPVGSIIDSEYTIRYHENEMKNYPHLFKRLEWWEEREISEMPKYVKTEAFNGKHKKVFKVKSWDGFNQIINFEDGMEGATKFWFPATEQEYAAYQQSIQSK